MVVERHNPTQAASQQRIQTQADVRSAGDLLRELSNEASMLVRQEIDLAKLEMSETLNRMLKNIAWIAVGGAVAYAGFLALVQAAVNGLGIGMWQGISLNWVAWLAPLIIGVVIAVIGYVMIQSAISSLKKQNIVPEKTLETMRENKQWLENRIR